MSPASASELLATFLHPARVQMLGAQHVALLRDLHANRPRRSVEVIRLGPPKPEAIKPERVDDAPDADPDDSGDVMPWDVPIYSVEGGLAVVDVCGPIVKGYDCITCWFWGLASLDRIQAAVADLSTRKDVAMVVFNFNSPGGVVTGVAETGEMIAALGQASKLTIAYTDTMCASAAYWLASQCREVVVSRSADVGSIGTYMTLYDYSGWLAELGIKLDFFRAGDLKGIGVMGRSLTDEEKAFLQADVDRTNARFIAAVRAGRAAGGEVADSTMQGQWFDGEMAVQLNLADRIVLTLPALIDELRGTLNRALATAVAAQS